MSGRDGEEQQAYKVVVNHEEQYSIWPQGKVNPPGWASVGVEGAKEDCLKYIKQVWTDMRPRSLRLRMEAQEGER